MKLIISLLCAGIFASASSGSLAEEDKDFFNFVAKNNKSYKHFSEMTKRKANWKKSKWSVEAMNSVKSQAVFDINNTADLDDDEYRLMLGLSMDAELLAQLEH